MAVMKDVKHLISTNKNMKKLIIISLLLSGIATMTDAQNLKQMSEKDRNEKEVNGCCHASVLFGRDIQIYINLEMENKW